MVLDDSSSSSTNTNHQYPDPEFVPRFPWSGDLESRFCTQSLDVPRHEAVPIKKDLTAHDSDREIFGLNGTRHSRQVSPTESEYEYREDSAK